MIFSRFNSTHRSANATPNSLAGQGGDPKSSLLNTLDLVGGASERTKSVVGGPGSRANPTPAIDDPSSSSSSSSGGDDDSFTCSEFEYENGGGQTPLSHQTPRGGGSATKDLMSDGGGGGGMVFSKLATSPGPLSGAAAPLQHNDGGESSDDFVASLPPIPLPGGSGGQAGPGKTWESLLDWTPTYSAFCGVFKDIAELPHAAAAVSGGDGSGVAGFIEGGFSRPSPLGDHNSDEQYI